MSKLQIAIIDFGSQYTHLITRRIRQLGVLAEIFPPTVSVKELSGIKGLILSGGPNSVHDRTAVKYNAKLLDLPVPILGLCYGHQLLAQHFGGKVVPGKTKEYGLAHLEVINSSKLFSGLPKQSRVWMSHGDSVSVLPKDFIVGGQTFDCPIAAMANDKKKMYGLQFHPEVSHTVMGQQIIKNFVFAICHCRVDWSLEKYWKQIVADLKKTVGRRKVFLLVSGGVDSSVCFALLEKVLGKTKVFGLHIDNGFMRQNESARVKKALAQAGFGGLKVVDASATFLQAVKGVIDPEEKRAIIGRTFLRVKDEVMAELKMKPADWILGQGTIYPDTIETGSTKHADKIKTHHNRVKEILTLMKLGQVVEPLATLYKDEVRELGKKIGLPAALISRHPFPGPGLSIRVLCSDGREKVENLAEVNRRLKKIVGAAYQSTVLPIKSVGVQGDNRTYRHPALLSGPMDWEKLHHLSVRITNEMPEVNRVVYLLNQEQVDLNKIKTKAEFLTKSRLDLLRVVDEGINKVVKAEKLAAQIWQFPIVLLPLGVRGGSSIILRPIESKEAMTVNFYRPTKKVVNKMLATVLENEAIDLVMYDITNKPPATIEWE
ncbi:MAG: glutamine-hydrolyzing GMP synthase [Patescibacteria group bacterium]|nr:glutamine-hydrolyzing GMP synthase [Patescibacteria group bacterium]